MPSSSIMACSRHKHRCISLAAIVWSKAPPSLPVFQAKQWLASSLSLEHIGGWLGCIPRQAAAIEPWCAEHVPFFVWTCSLLVSGAWICTRANTFHNVKVSQSVKGFLMMADVLHYIADSTLWFSRKHPLSKKIFSLWTCGQLCLGLSHYVRLCPQYCHYKLI